MKSLVALLAMFLTLLAHAQNDSLYNSFNAACGAGDVNLQRNILADWQSQSGKQAEFYASQFNFYFQLARESGLAFVDSPQGNDNIKGLDSLGNPVFYIVNQNFYHQDKIDSAMHWINKGIAAHPDRLDLWFGKIHVLGLVGQWENFDKTTTDCIAESVRLKNAWQWTFDEPVEDAQAFLLNAIHDYLLMVYDTGEDALLPYMENVAQHTTKYYTNEPIIWTDLGIAQLLLDKIELAIAAFKKAEILAPHDPVVLANLGRAFVLQGDTSKAKIAFQKLIDLGDTDYKSYAEEELLKLK